MDAEFFRQKADLCMRLADGLSLNNPGRFQLMDMAEELQRRVAEVQAQNSEQPSVLNRRNSGPIHSDPARCIVRQGYLVSFVIPVF